MFDFISLEVKCPICNRSLLDDEVRVDNEASIGLNIHIGGKKGLIRLSSIYGSYNYSHTIEIPPNSIGEFFCPHCESQLLGESECEQCSAPVVGLRLAEGGEVSFCSRAGCKKHAIEFDDLEYALKYFHDRFSYGKVRRFDTPVTTYEAPEPSAETITREIIRTGTFLHTFCPHCKKTLLDDDKVKFKIEQETGEAGFLMLSPYFNVFTHMSTIRLPESKAVKDIKCFHCNTSLIEEERNCGKCGSRTARVSVAAMSKLIDFYLCSRKGCTWHGLSNEDLEDIILEDSEEW